MAIITEEPVPAPTPLGAAWEPSGSSASGSDVDDQDDDEALFTLSEQDKINIINMHPDLKPSQVPAGNQSGKGPLVVLNPEELHRLAAEGRTKEEEEEGEAPEPELWEEVVDCVLWSIPFAFLFYCMQVLTRLGLRS